MGQLVVFILCNTSIVQGDMQSNSMAKAMVWNCMQFIDQVHAPVRIRQYVDDLNLSDHGYATRIVLRLSDAVTELMKWANAHRLRLSDNSWVVAGSPAVAQKLADIILIVPVFASRCQAG